MSTNNKLLTTPFCPRINKFDLLFGLKSRWEETSKTNYPISYGKLDKHIERWNNAKENSDINSLTLNVKGHFFQNVPLWILSIYACIKCTCHGFCITWCWHHLALTQQSLAFGIVWIWHGFWHFLYHRLCLWVWLVFMHKMVVLVGVSWMWHLHQTQNY